VIASSSLRPTRRYTHLSLQTIAAVRHLAAALAVVWFVAAAAIEVGSYLPVDPQWSLLTTAALFGSSFLIAAVGAFFMAPELTAIRRWPVSTLHWLKWLGVAWAIYTAIWFIALFTIPGGPTPLRNAWLAGLRPRVRLQQSWIAHSHGQGLLYCRCTNPGSRFCQSNNRCDGSHPRRVQAESSSRSAGRSFDGGWTG